MTQAQTNVFSKTMFSKPGGWFSTDFVRRYRRKKQLVEAINTAYADAPDEQETKTQQGMHMAQRKLVEGE